MRLMPELGINRLKLFWLPKRRKFSFSVCDGPLFRLYRLMLFSLSLSDSDSRVFWPTFLTPLYLEGYASSGKQKEKKKSSPRSFLTLCWLTTRREPFCPKIPVPSGSANSGLSFLYFCAACRSRLWLPSRRPSVAIDTPFRSWILDSRLDKIMLQKAS